jgi:hypothetical protein
MFNPFRKRNKLPRNQALNTPTRKLPNMGGTSDYVVGGGGDMTNMILGTMAVNSIMNSASAEPLSKNDTDPVVDSPRYEPAPSYTPSYDPTPSSPSFDSTPSSSGGDFGGGGGGGGID